MLQPQKQEDKDEKTERRVKAHFILPVQIDDRNREQAYFDETL